MHFMFDLLSQIILIGPGNLGTNTDVLHYLVMLLQHWGYIQCSLLLRKVFMFWFQYHWGIFCDVHFINSKHWLG